MPDLPMNDEIASLYADEETSIARADKAIAEAQVEEERTRWRTEDRIGWTPRKAKLYELGHPWADPASYPSADTLREAPADEWKHSIETWGFPLAPKFAERRKATYDLSLSDLRSKLQRYEEVRTRGVDALNPGEIQYADGNEFEIAAAVRQALSLLYNHATGLKSRIHMMRAHLIEKGEL